MSATYKLRVCHLVSDDIWGGAEAMIRGLIEDHVARGSIAISLICLNDGGLAAFAKAAGIQVRVVSERDRSFFSLLHRIDRALRELEPHLIHSHRYKENLLSCLLGAKHGARSVVTLHGDEPPLTRRSRLKVQLRRAVTRLLSAWVRARFAAVSNDLPALLGLSKSQWVTIPNGIALPRRAHREAADPAAQACPPTIGWVGRLVPVKDIRLLLEAVAQLPPTLSSTRVLLVGDGPERDSLEAQAARLGISERVEFRGFVSDPSPELARMTIFALPSRYEGVPIALLEAMASGLACVAAAVGGIPEIAGDDECVRLVSSRRPVDWAFELARLMTHRDDARALGARARKRVAEKFSLEAVGNAYLALYQSMVPGLTHATSREPNPHGCSE